MKDTLLPERISICDIVPAVSCKQGHLYIECVISAYIYRSFIH